MFETTTTMLVSWMNYETELTIPQKLKRSVELLCFRKHTHTQCVLSALNADKMVAKFKSKFVPCLSAENIDALFGMLDWQLSEDP